MNPTRNTARLAGLLWFLGAVMGGFGMFYVRSKVIVPGDAAATAANIVSGESLFRVATVSSLISHLLFFFFALTPFFLLKEAHKALATVFLISVLMTVAIAVVNTLNNFGAMAVLSGADYLKVFSPEQLRAMAMIFLRLGNSGQGLVEVFWTPYFFSFGLLVIKSRFLPRILGVLLILMSVGYAVNIYTKFLVPEFHPAMFTGLAMMLGAFGGIPTMLWLMIKGGRVEPLGEPA